MKTWTWHPRTRIAESTNTLSHELTPECPLPSSPSVIRGLASGWPLVQAGKNGETKAASYLSGYDQGIPVKTMCGAPDIEGRFFYNEQMRGYNFAVHDMPLKLLFDQLIALAPSTNPPSIYAGSLPTAQCFPGFDDDNIMPFSAVRTTPRIWIGNATHVAPHYDISDNIAVVALGQRRFTLFPPAQTPNLYVGPLDITIAGQPVSMVDMRAPDLTRFPLFAQAMETAIYADLEAGDAIFIPSLWWHCVEAYAPINILVNYWHNAPTQSSPFAALIHAMLAVRDLPDAEREAWHVWFDHYVFSENAVNAGSHLPRHAQRLLGPPSEERALAIRSFVLNAIK